MFRMKKIIGRDKNSVSSSSDVTDNATVSHSGCDKLDVVTHRIKSRSLDNRTSQRENDEKVRKSATATGIFPAAVASNLTSQALEILEGTLTMRRSATHVTKLNTRLLESIPGGDIAYMKRLMAMGASVNATCRLNHVSACHIASFYDNDALELLLKTGAECTRTDKLGRTPLHLAAWEGNVKHITLLLHFPQALTESILDCVALSPKTVEAVRRQSVPVNILTNAPCQINVDFRFPNDWIDGMEHNCRNVKEMLPIFQQGWTALHAASARAHHHCVQLLLAAGANAHAQDLLCRTPLDVVGCAHFDGHKIEANDFKETVKLLIKAGGRFQRFHHKSNPLDTPLHTAVELESEGAVDEVLLGGASATAWNSQGLTAMHVCVKKRNKELLRLLANQNPGNLDPHLATVDVKDQSGATVLCAAIKEGWLQGVCIALGAGASITMKENGESCIHTAAALGNVDILQEILNIAKLSNTVDFRNEKGETPLFKAIIHNHLEALKILLTAGSHIETTVANKANVLHVAAEHGCEEILKYLLEYNSHATAIMVNRMDNVGPPLFYAVFNNHLTCAEMLIAKGAQVHYYVNCKNAICEDTLTFTSLLHIAASKNYCEIADLILRHDKNTINALDSADQTPLHDACSHGNREMIALLIRAGADLSGFHESRRCKMVPIDLLMNNLSKPTEFMEEMFDSYIQGMGLQESKCEVTVDFKILVPKESDAKQMRVIKALLNTGNRYDQSRLLLHPLVQSFVYLKWKEFLPFFYSILALYGCFVLSLNVFTVSVFYYTDKNKQSGKQKDVPFILHSSLWIQITYLTVCLITIQEVIFIKMKTTRYLFSVETWLKFWSILLAVVLLRVVSWDTGSDPPEWARLVASVALLFSWFEMMFLLSRFPDWGFYVLMFGKVANKVVKILLSFLFLIFGFSITFMIQFRAKPPFEGPWSAFVTTMVMMTSEFDYQDTISKKSAIEVSASIIILRIIFMSFLILISIILMNLLVGVAVDNVNRLEIIGNIKRLEKQIEFITSLEGIVCNKFFKKILPRCLYKRWLRNKKWENVIVLRPRKSTCRNCRRLPARLREAIFDRAHLQKKQSDEVLGSKLFQMKLDEIYKVVVNKQLADNEQRMEKDKALKKIIDEIQEIRCSVELLKTYLNSNRRRTLNSQSVPLLVLESQKKQETINL
ncbi:transient receptor potential channel pyrexia isoform X1 [Helicoverpa armigera]|uniref:transient receptor potential channel pyrexia isoform X1 n=1 Tax=Helicoverpa armigera TaxID=29058 RepID=UPI0030837951